MKKFPCKVCSFLNVSYVWISLYLETFCYNFTEWRLYAFSVYLSFLHPIDPQVWHLDFTELWDTVAMPVFFSLLMFRWSISSILCSIANTHFLLVQFVACPVLFGFSLWRFSFLIFLVVTFVFQNFNVLTHCPALLFPMLLIPSSTLLTFFLTAPFSPGLGRNFLSSEFFFFISNLMTPSWHFTYFTIFAFNRWNVIFWRATLSCVCVGCF